MNHQKSISRSSLNIEHLKTIPVGGSASRLCGEEISPIFSRKRPRRDRCLARGICFTSFFIMFLVYGIHTSFGVILAALLDHFGESKARTAWIGSIAVNLLFLFSPVTSWMAESYGVRVVTILGGSFMFVGLFLSSYAPRLSFMYLSYGILFGSGTSLCTTMALIVIGDYFDRNNVALVVGFIASGSSLGTVVLPPSIEMLVEACGWRAALRAMGAAGVALALLGFVYPYKPRSEEHGRKDEEKSMLDFGVLKNRAFLLWICATSVSAFGYFLPHFFLVRYAEDMGIPLSQGTWLISYLGVSSAVGRLLFGKLSDLCCHRNIQIYRACMLLSGVASFLCPMATSYAALILYVVVLGLLDGSYIGLMSIVTMDIVGLDNIAPAWGILFFCQSFFYLLGPPAAGLMYDSFNSFKPVFYLAAGPMFLGSLFLFFIPCAKVGDRSSPANNQSGHSPTAVMVPTIVISTEFLGQTEVEEHLTSL